MNEVSEAFKERQCDNQHGMLAFATALYVCSERCRESWSSCVVVYFLSFLSRLPAWVEGVETSK